MQRLIIGIILAAVAFSAAAVAQTTPAPAPSFFESLRPLLQDVMNVAVTIFVGMLGYYLKQKYGIDITAERRASLQIATTNAAGLYAKDGDMNKAVAYVEKAAPDAVKHFELTSASIPEKIEAKVGILEAGGAVTPVLPGPVPPQL